jgi:hypothetical protein
MVKLHFDGQPISIQTWSLQEHQNPPCPGAVCTSILESIDKITLWDSRIVRVKLSSWKEHEVDHTQDRSPDCAIFA